MQNIGQSFKGKAYRVESGLLCGPDTVQALLDFEADELGNEDIREQANRVVDFQRHIDFSTTSANLAVWVTDSQEAAVRYHSPISMEPDEDSVGDDDFEYELTEPNIILATDGEDGYLVVQGLPRKVSNKELADLPDEWENSNMDTSRYIQSAWKAWEVSKDFYWEARRAGELVEIYQGKYYVGR